MTRAARTDQVDFTRARHIPEVELVSAAYRDRSFPEHAHEEYVIGAITTGAELLAVGGQTWLADTGSVLRLHPGEVHANTAQGPETLRYSVLYVPRDTLLGCFDAALDLRFPTPVVWNPRLHRIVCETHATLSSPTADKLAQESALATLARMIGGHPIQAMAGDPIPSDAVDQARRYIEDNLLENFGLGDLSRLTGLSPFHLVRSFKKAVGLSPVAYRNQRRIFAARQRLIDGQATAEVALDLGYADQSHFTRHFQRLIGISPNRYARGVGIARGQVRAEL